MKTYNSLSFNFKIPIMCFKAFKKNILFLVVFLSAFSFVYSQTIQYDSLLLAKNFQFPGAKPKVTGNISGKVGPNVFNYIVGKPWSGGNKDGIRDNASLPFHFNFTVDALGNYYVHGGNRIRKIDPNGVVTTYAGNWKEAHINGNRQSASIALSEGPIAVHPVTKDIYFFDKEFLSRKIYYSLFKYDVQVYVQNYIRVIRHTTGEVFDLSSSERGFLPGGLNRVRFGDITDMEFDSKGVLYLTDRDNHCIWQLSGNTISILAGGGDPTINEKRMSNYGFLRGADGYRDGSPGQALFNFPRALAIDPKTNAILVSDYMNYRVRRIDPLTREVTTIAGTGVESSIDTSLNAATFHSINDLTVDDNGNIYLIDNEVIRKIDVASQMVNTLTGSGAGATLWNDEKYPLVENVLIAYGSSIHFNPIEKKIIFKNNTTIAEFSKAKFEITPQLSNDYRFDIMTGEISANTWRINEKIDQEYTIKGYTDNSFVDTKFHLRVTDTPLIVKADTALELKPTSARVYVSVTDVVSNVPFKGLRMHYTRGGFYMGMKDLDSAVVGQSSFLLQDLQPDTEYEFYAYATTSDGSSILSNHKTFRTPKAGPIVLTTTAAKNILPTSATVGGNITDDKMDSVRSRGIIYSTEKQQLTTVGSFEITASKKNGIYFIPLTNSGIRAVMVSGSGMGLFDIKLQDLKPGKKYYALAFAANRFETTLATDTIEFTTDTQLPVLDSLMTIKLLRPTSVTLAGNILNDKGDKILERGVIYDTVKTRLVLNNAYDYALARNCAFLQYPVRFKDQNNQVGTFENNIGCLIPGKRYYALAYARNSSGTSYSKDTLTFITPNNLATVTTTAASNIGRSYATVGGVVVTDNGDSVKTTGIRFRRGFSDYDSTILADYPTVGANMVIQSGSYNYDTVISRLIGNSKIYYRAYAVNESGTSYGDVMSFTTLPPPVAPTLGDGSIGSPTAHSIPLSGTIISSDNDTIMEKGFVIDTLGATPIYTNIFSNTDRLNSIFQIKCGTGMNDFDTVFTQLASNSSYTVRAYAINSIGVSYGKSYSFTTLSEPSSAFLNSPIQLPGRIEAEYFDKGDDGVSFHEVAYASDPKAIENAGLYSVRRWDASNLSAVEKFRATAVDIEATGDNVTNQDGKNYQVAFTTKDEWLKYKVNLNTASTKTYKVSIRYARGASADSLPGMAAIEVDGILRADSIRLYGTRTWGTYSNAIVDTLSLSPGLHEIKLKFINAGSATGGSVANINFIDVTEVQANKTKLLNLNLNFGVLANIKNIIQTAVVKGKGLKPFAFFRIRMHSTPIELASGYCDSLGDFSQPISLPQNTTPGKHSIDVSTIDSDGNKIAESAYITVDANGFITEIINMGAGNIAPTELTLQYADNTDTDSSNTFIAKIIPNDYSRDIHTYSFTAGEGDDDNALFRINSDSLILSTVADFETKSEYKVRLRVTDNAENTYDTAFIIKLVDGNDEVAGIKLPKIADSVTIRLAENRKAVTTVLALDPKDSLIQYQYSIQGGVDGEKFRITSLGILEFLDEPDFENPIDSGANNNYEVIIEALNLFDKTIKYTQKINVEVVDTLEKPDIINVKSTDVKINTANLSAKIITGGSPINQRGFLIGFIDGASMYDLYSDGISRIDSGSGDGEFIAELSGLSENSDYVYRAYAMTETDTVYSEQMLFKTQSESKAPVVNYKNPIKLKQHSEALVEPIIVSGSVPQQLFNLVKTIAGNGTSGSKDALPVNSNFNRPFGIVANVAGQVFVADAYNHSIRYFIENDTVFTIGGSGAGVNNESDTGINEIDAKFNKPIGLAIDKENNIYVSDQGNNQIRMITQNRRVYRIAGADKIGTAPNSGDANGNGKSAKFNQPEGLAVDRSGQYLYVADRANHLIRRINLITKRVTTYAGSGVAGTKDSNDLLTAEFNEPTGLYVDENDNVYVTEAQSHTVRKIDVRNGTVITIAGSGVAGSADGLGIAAQFNSPASIQGDEIGNLYVADLNNHAIRKIDTTGNVSLFTGTGLAGTTEGKLNEATFNEPYGLFLDQTGSVIYVSHSSSTGNKISSIGLGGYVLTDSLPAGLKFNNRTGVISGAATEAKADTTYKVHYANIYGNDSTTINIEVVANNKKISYQTPQSYVVNNAISSLNPTITGGTFSGGVNGRFTVSPDLPSGLSIDTATGVISGKPLLQSDLTDYFVSGWDSTESVVTKLSIQVDPQIQLSISGTKVVSTKQYDGSRTASVTPGILSDIVNNHDVKVTAVANYETASVGNNKTIVTVYTLTGADSSKYMAPINDTLSNGEITARQLAVSGVTINKIKIYDGTVSATVTAVTFTNTIESDDVKVSAAASYDTSSVGRGKIITTVFSISGDDAANYIKPADSVITDGQINQKQLTITSPTITLKKTIDGNTNAAIQKGSLVGVVDGDDVTVSAAADYATPDLGENKAITVVYTLGGADKDNYLKPSDSVTTKGVIVDVVPSQLVYTPSSQVSGLNKAIVDMVPSSQGGKVIHYAITPALQPGLVFDTATGKISGTRTSLSGSGSGSMEYTITATNSGGSTTGKVTIIYNVPATNITLSKTNLYEGNLVGEVIGSLTSTDPDAGDTHSYSLVSGAGDTDNRFFSINGDKLLAGRVFDYKQRNRYSIRLRTTDQEGMSYEKAFTITVSEKPVVVGRSSDLYYGVTNGTPVISRGSQSQLQVSGNGIASVQWAPATGLSNPNVLNPIARPKQTTTYTITITNNAGSVTTLQVTVEVKNDYLVEPQNIVTPNGDGINDFWVIKNLEEYPDNEVTIYSREGKIMYRAANYNQRWDGTSGGRKLATGTYYYILRFRDNPNALHKGFITLLHE